MHYSINILDIMQLKHFVKLNNGLKFYLIFSNEEYSRVIFDMVKLNIFKL